MNLTLRINLPRFPETVIINVEIFCFNGDAAVGVDDQIDIESVKINGEEFINELTWDQMNVLYDECWKEIEKQKEDNKINNYDGAFRFSGYDDEL